MAFAKALLQPPARLRALPDRWARWLRAALDPSVRTLGPDRRRQHPLRRPRELLDPADHRRSSVSTSTSRPRASCVVGTSPGRQPAVPVTAKVIAIDGKPVPADLQVARLRRTARQRARTHGQRDRPATRTAGRMSPDAEPQQDRASPARRAGAQPADLDAAADRPCLPARRCSPAASCSPCGVPTIPSR